MIYFKGFYQSERFFADIEDDVRKTFCFNMELINSRSREMMKIIDADEHAVSIHIRRGDYLLPKFWANAGCVCQLPYYKNAITELKNMSRLLLFMFFLMI